MDNLNENVCDAKDHCCNHCWRFVQGGFCRLTSPYKKVLQSDFCARFIHTNEIPSCLALNDFKTACKNVNVKNELCLECCEKLCLIHQ